MTRTMLYSTTFLVALGCGHSRDVEKPGQPPEVADEERVRAEASKPIPRSTSFNAPSGTPLAASPAGLLEPGALEKIQDELQQEKLLGDHRPGALDGPTKAALRTLQKNENLPETGYPDAETVRKLGLDPDELFKAGRVPEAKKQQAEDKEEAKEKAADRN